MTHTQADLDKEVYRQIVAQSQAAQAAADHAGQVSIVCRFPIQTQPPWNTQSLAWDNQGVTFRFHVYYAETDAVVRVDEELKWRGLAWVVTGLGSRRESADPANDCRRASVHWQWHGRRAIGRVAQQVIPLRSDG